MGKKMLSFYRNGGAENEVFEAQVRPTIGWSLSCEGPGERLKAFDKIKSVKSPAMFVGGHMRGCIIAGMVLACIAVCGTGCSAIFVISPG